MVINDEEWEDITEEEIEVKKSKPIKLQRERKKRYSAVIQRRINALKVLQLQQKAMEAKVSVLNCVSNYLCCNSV